MHKNNLNPEQLAAVEYSDGPLMILAGAGSGKTRTLVHKVEYLINELNYSPYNILAVTFSNKAAKEMRERVATTLKVDAQTIQVTTFHALCAKILRMESSFIGMSRHFTIYDDGESNAVIKNVLSRRNINHKDIHPSEVMAYIQSLHNHGFFPGCEQYPEYYKDIAIYRNDFLEPYHIDYLNELRLSNAVDFGGLITGVVELFLKHPEVLARYENRYKYVMVDEYQDTNKVQFNLIHLLTKHHKKVCVVGDEDQSIYSWRGADIKNILDFEKYFEDVKMIKLEQNYRSSKNIIEAASFVIEKNEMRKGKKMWTDNPEGESILVMECRDDRVEAEYIGKELITLVKEDVNLNEVAIFYRNNAQSRQIEDKLRELKLPYRIIGGIKFYERKEIKDLISYLRLLVNEKDSLALTRVINLPARGIGATTLKKFEDYAIINKISLFEALEVFATGNIGVEIKVSKKVTSSLMGFVDLIRELRDLNEAGEKPSVIYEKVLYQSGYLDLLKGTKSYENQARLENLDELLTAIKQFEQEHEGSGLLSQFLETITLDQTAEEAANDHRGQISLMTVHGSKGLEYEYVFLAGVEETLFPSFQSLERGANAIEEERRLFYVAMTRAMKKLVITFAKSRMIYGSVKFNEPSRFLFEIPKEYYTWSFAKSSHYQDQYYEDDFSQISDDEKLGRSRIYSQVNSFTYHQGSKVKHQLYGEGIVMQSEGQGVSEKVTIRFGNGSIKKFVVQYSPIEVLG